MLINERGSQTLWWDSFASSHIHPPKWRMSLISSDSSRSTWMKRECDTEGMLAACHWMSEVRPCIRGSSTAISCCHVSTLYLTISDFFTPSWGRCWNRVHLSSLHTQLELTRAFIFAGGRWVSPTQTFRPLRRLLSYSVSLPISLPLFACAHSNQARFLFLCFSFPPFFFHFLPFLSSPFLFSTLRPLSGTRQIVLSEEANRSGGQQILCVSRGASMCVLACVCVWHSTGYGTGESSAFLSQLVTQKPQVRSGR